MKLNCGPTWAEKKAALEKWHPYFAWWPVRVGPQECRWLETVERKGRYGYRLSADGWDWEYRLPRKAEEQEAV